MSVEKFVMLECTDGQNEVQVANVTYVRKSQSSDLTEVYVLGDVLWTHMPVADVVQLFSGEGQPAVPYEPPQEPALDPCGDVVPLLRAKHDPVCDRAARVLDALREDWRTLMTKCDRIERILNEIRNL